MTLHDSNKITHERADVPHGPDRARVVHARRADDADVSEVVGPGTVATEHQTAAAELLEAVLAPDRDVDLVVAERRRQQVDQTRAVLEQPQHVPHPTARRELRLPEDVLDAVGVHVMRPRGVVLVQGTYDRRSHLRVDAGLADRRAAHARGIERYER